MTKKLLFQLLSLLTINLVAQNSQSSVLTNENYQNDPFQYLSKINSSTVPTSILIDRVSYDELIMNMNGYDKVTTVSTSEWAQIYNDLQNSSSDSTILPSLDIVEAGMDLIYKSEKGFPIGIIDVTFNKIKQSALSNNELIENSDFLFDNGATASSYKAQRVIALSCLNHNVHGNKVGFYVGSFFTFSNNTNQILESVEIDFDDGMGYRQVERNETTTAIYGGGNEFLNIKAKLFFLNETTGNIEVLHANSSVFRTGSSPFSKADKLPFETRALGVDNADYYPAPVYTDVEVCKPFCSEEPCCITKSIVSINHSLIEYNIIYSDENIDKNKLRRPLIICDGFDPGDRRNIESNIIGLKKTLPKEEDYRGLEALLNGDPSPWYKGSPSANLIERLKQDGYDIVIVNFLNGAGDIRNNAGIEGLRGFLNDVINGPIYRDNKTEEITLIGPSMGGLITRHALATMEKNNEEHFVKNWISFDAPQKGAHIPLGLQYAVNFLSKIQTTNLIPAFASAKASFIAGTQSLNTPAAKQLLTQHFSTNSYTGKPDPLYDSMYADLKKLGYPKQSKNYGISNGGKSKLYPWPNAKILDFKMTSYTYVTAYSNSNHDGLNKTFSGKRLGFLNPERKDTRNQIAYENAAGGWNPALYSLNCHPGNKNRKNENDIRYIKSTFISTASAFGIDVDRTTVLNTYEDFTNCSDNESGKIKTPFDEIRGMENNEEHVRISLETGDYLMDHVLREDFNESKRPRTRNGESASQEVKGNVAFTSKEKYSFAGSGSSFSIMKNADVTMNSGKTIIFNPGFSIKKGGKLAAGIKDVKYGTVFRKKENNISVDYTEISPFTGNLFDYSNANEPEKFHDNSLSISPNPFTSSVKVIIDDLKLGKNGTIEIYSGTGERVISKRVTQNGEYSIQTGQLAPGIYICIVRLNNRTKTQKLVKL